MEPILKDGEVPYPTQMALLVGRYATPLAILIVSAGIVLTAPVSPVKEIATGLLVFGLVFNLATVRFLPRNPDDPRTFIKVRMGVNLAVNVALNYYLGGFWKPTWLLLALTPLATGIYGSRRDTLIASAVASGLLLGLQALRPFQSPLEWGELGSEIAFIILVSLLFNELAALARNRRA